MPDWEDESKPLTYGSGSAGGANHFNNNNNDNDDTTSNRRWTGAGLVILGCILGMAVMKGYGWYQDENNNNNANNIMTLFDLPANDNDNNTKNNNNEEDDGTMMITRSRPVCSYYVVSKQHAKTKTVPPRIIQTSMNEPSQPWTSISCYPEKYPAHLNTFGNPDAVLQVNFSQLAHPKRQNVPILGFGGAFTEASALNFHRLSTSGQAAALELLFGKSGLGYSIGRFHINSCDFSVQSYSFDETVDDFELNDFDTNVTHDVQSGMIDFATRAKQVYEDAWVNNKNNNKKKQQQQDDQDDDDDDDEDSSDDYDDDKKEDEKEDNNTSDNNNNNDDDDDNNNDDNPYKHEVFRFFASPWSPPSWMKLPTWQDTKINPSAVYAANMTYSETPCLRDGVGPNSRYAAAWALYFSKFITAYAQQGIDMWAVTVQNEPEFPAPWEACSYQPLNESDFVAYHLGPVLERDHPNVKLFGFDHNKDHINTWANILLNESLSIAEHRKSAARYIAGTAYHWYAGGMDRLLDGAIGIPNLHRLQHNLLQYGILERHLVLGSESCHCPSTGYAGGDIQNYWARAERYAHTILADLAAGSNGWVEWNFILDGIGGPNHLHNLCEATILAVPHRAANLTEQEQQEITPLPDFEHTPPMGGDGSTIIGDDRTREELNAQGFAAKYLDVGVAVQPIYHYMGHVSRYIRPGSLAVMGLVNQSMGGEEAGHIFKPKGSVVVGGGINDLARTGVEVTVWPCEGSTRQHFHWDFNGQRHIEVLGHDWLGNPTKSCFGKVNDKDLLGLTLTSCKSKLDNAGVFDIVAVGNDDEGRFFIKLMNPVKGEPGEQCLIIKELANGGGAYGPRGGAQVAFGNCAHESAKWNLDMESGIASSTYFAAPGAKNPKDAAVCMTTGWPFLQMGAFQTPNGESDKTVVILNEARDSANYVLKDGDKIVLTGSIPPRSIQTVLLD